MSQYVPLDQLITTLLALADVAPNLPPEAQSSLSALSDKLDKKVSQLHANDEEAYVKLLSRTGRTVFVQLYFSQAAFKAAKTAWDQQLTVRVGLDTDDEWGQHTNPMEQISPTLARTTPAVQQTATMNFWQRLSHTVSEALRNPNAFAQDNQTLKQLASLAKLPWPR